MSASLVSCWTRASSIAFRFRVRRSELWALIRLELATRLVPNIATQEAPCRETNCRFGRRTVGARSATPERPGSSSTAGRLGALSRESTRQGVDLRQMPSPSGCPPRTVVGIAASAGGFEPLKTILNLLPPDLDLAVLIVMHISRNRPNLLAGLLDRVSKYEVVEAVDGASLQSGYAYVAPPDHHLTLLDGQVHLARGPRENRVRPAADPSFARSLAGTALTRSAWCYQGRRAMAPAVWPRFTAQADWPSLRTVSATLSRVTVSTRHSSRTWRAPLWGAVVVLEERADFLRRICKRLAPHTRQQLSDEISEREVQPRTFRQFLTQVLSAPDPESESS